MKILIREAREEDTRFIHAAWMKCLRSSPPFSLVKGGLANDNNKKIITDIISKSFVSIACDQRDENQCFGFMVRDKDTLHFAYTKGTFREFGIFTQLYKETKCENLGFYSTWGSRRVYNKILQRKGLVYNPYRLFRI